MNIEQKIFEKNKNFHGVKGLVFVDDKILVYRRDMKTENYPLFIDLPGGGKEDKESAMDTFTREVKEEFGISVKCEDVVYAKKYTSVMDTSKESYFIVVKTKNKKEDIIFGNEGIEYFLITTKDYLELKDSIPRHREKVIDYLNNS